MLHTGLPRSPFFGLSSCPTHSSDAYLLSICDFHISSLTAWCNCPLQRSRPTERSRALLQFHNTQPFPASAGQMPREGHRGVLGSLQRPGLLGLRWLQPAKMFVGISLGSLAHVRVCVCVCVCVCVHVCGVV
jgi:hypothetical protein